MNIDPTNTKPPIDFFFERPVDVAGLSRSNNVARSMGAIASRMVQEKRSRTVHPDGRRENVSEHENMLARVAPHMAAEMYPWLDRGRIALYATIHDDVEAYVGDTPTDSIAQHDPAAKKERERLGVEQLVLEYQDIAPAYVNDILAYEAQGAEDYEAQFVRIVDKFMVLLIHIPNNGEVLLQNYTYDEYMSATYESERKLLEQYPHFIELIEMRTELAQYIGDQVYKSAP